MAYLAHDEIALGQLLKQVLGSQSIVQLELEVLNLRFRIGKLCLREFET